MPINRKRTNTADLISLDVKGSPDYNKPSKSNSRPSIGQTHSGRGVSRGGGGVVLNFLVRDLGTTSEEGSGS